MAVEKFDNEFYLRDVAFDIGCPQLASTFRLPGAIRDNWCHVFKSQCCSTADLPTLMFGQAGTFAQAHLDSSHSEAYSMQLTGVKQWLLIDWNLLMTGSTSSLCVHSQQPGTLVYIPRLWVHGAVNPKHSISLQGDFFTGESLVDMEFSNLEPEDMQKCMMFYDTPGVGSDGLAKRCKASGVCIQDQTVVNGGMLSPQRCERRWRSISKNQYAADAFKDADFNSDLNPDDAWALDYMGNPVGWKSMLSSAEAKEANCGSSILKEDGHRNEHVLNDMVNMGQQPLPALLDFASLESCSTLAMNFTLGLYGPLIDAEDTETAKLSPMGSLRLVLLSLRSAWKMLSILASSHGDHQQTATQELQAHCISAMSRSISASYEWANWRNIKEQMGGNYCEQWPMYEASDPELPKKPWSTEEQELHDAFGHALKLLKRIHQFVSSLPDVDASTLNSYTAASLDLPLAIAGTTAVVQSSPAFGRPQPILKLRNGFSVPLMGFGTGCSVLSEGRYDDMHNNTTKAEMDEIDEVAIEALTTAMKQGVTFFDTAELYGNFQHLQKAMERAGKTAGELQFMSKVDHENKSKGDIKKEVKRQLNILGALQLEVLMVHHPSDNGKSKLGWADIWSEMEALVDEGLVKALGWSFTTSPLMFLLHTKKVRHRPKLVQLQVDLHKIGNIDERSGDIISWAREQDIGIVSVSSTNTPDIIPGWQQPIVQAIAEKHGVTAASVPLRWAMQLGMIVIPCSGKPDHIRTNTEALHFSLSDDEMHLLDGLIYMTSVCPPDRGSDVFGVDQALKASIPTKLVDNRCCPPAGTAEGYFSGNAGTADNLFR